EALRAHAKELSSLIQPHFGEHVADMSQLVRNNEMFRTAAVYDEELVDQVGGLPLGSKLIVDPWDGGVKLFRSEPVEAPALRERAEFAVTPFMPFLDYVVEKVSVPAHANGIAAQRTSRGHQMTSQSGPTVKKGAS